MEETQTRQQVRDRFTRLLGQHPPEVAPLVVLDPTLLSNDPFLARYPELAQFVAAHPEIRRNPHYYVQELPNPIAFRHRSSWQEAVVPPGGAPAQPECVLCVSTPAGAAPTKARNCRAPATGAAKRISAPPSGLLRHQDASR